MKRSENKNKMVNNKQSPDGNVVLDEVAFDETYKENTFYRKDMPDRRWLYNFVSYYESCKAARAIPAPMGVDEGELMEKLKEFANTALINYMHQDWLDLVPKGIMQIIKPHLLTPDARIVEVLKFYADERNWSLKDYRQYDAITSHIEQDKGNKAKQLLAEMGG